MTEDITISVLMSERKAPMDQLLRWADSDNFRESLNARLEEVFDDDGNPCKIVVEDVIPLVGGSCGTCGATDYGTIVEVIELPLDPESAPEVRLDHVGDIGKCIRDMSQTMSLYDGLTKQEWAAIFHVLQS